MSHPHTPHPERQTCMQVSEKFALHETTTHTKTPTPTKERQAFTQAIISMLATTIHKSNTTPHHQSGATTRTPNPPQTQEAKSRHPPLTRSRPAGLLSQSPIVCPAVSRSSVSHTTSHCLLCTKPRPLQAKGSSRHQGWPTATPFFVVLLRKEVIQPHLPVRLPCYDFVPIADPTFDGSLHKG